MVSKILKTEGLEHNFMKCDLPQHAFHARVWHAALAHSCLHLDGKPHPFNAGDVVAFSGDCHHSGAANEHAEPNYRLFSYVPTRGIDVPWNIDHCSTNIRRAAEVVTDAALHEYLHRKTNPSDGEFDDNVFKDWLYDWATGKFYKFTVPVWLEGLDTAESRKGCAVSNGQHAEIADGLIKCKRCHHFDVDDFVPCDTTDKKKLNDFRSQCPCKRVVPHVPNDECKPAARGIRKKTAR